MADHRAQIRPQRLPVLELHLAVLRLQVEREQDRLADVHRLALVADSLADQRAHRAAQRSFERRQEFLVGRRVARAVGLQQFIQASHFVLRNRNFFLAASAPPSKTK